MPIQAVTPRRLYRQVADQLRQLFDAGEFKAGDKLPTERELAERMGISRPTVREALIALEVEGRVRIRVGSGIYVTEPAQTSLPGSAQEGPFEVLRAREFMESAIAEEAARLASPDHIRRLDEVLNRMSDRSHPTRITIALDRSFHTGVAAILGNAVLVRVVRDLFNERMNPYFERLSSYFEDRLTWQEALEEHRVVRDALAKGDPEAAKAAMATHLRQSQERFSRSFSEEPVTPRGTGTEGAATDQPL